MLYLKDVQKEASDLHLLKLWILDQTLILWTPCIYLNMVGALVPAFTILLTNETLVISSFSS